MIDIPLVSDVRQILDERFGHMAQLYLEFLVGLKRTGTRDGLPEEQENILGVLSWCDKNQLDEFIVQLFYACSDALSERTAIDIPKVVTQFPDCYMADEIVLPILKKVPKRKWK
jgi:hypothetical protein